MRSMHIVAPNLDQSKPIDLNIKTSVLMDVFSLLTSVTVERAKQSNQLRAFIITLLCPPEPWFNNEVN